LYLDTSYIAKFYLEEPESPLIRELVGAADPIYSSLMAVAEFHAVLHRKMREGALTAKTAKELALRFSQHEKDRLWTFIPVTENILRKTGGTDGRSTSGAIPPHGRRGSSGDRARHWRTGNDQHMLAAASYFGLMGRSVSEKV
jgi:hypothetical protein